jgi:SHS2 domain-containing protein
MNTEKKDGTRRSSPIPTWIEALDHTADAGIIVRASNLKALFARAAWGMFSLITDPEDIRAQEKTRIAVEASDRHALMVKWLSELNFRHVTEHRLFCRFDLLALTDQRLEADIYGEKTDLSRHTICTEIKAVTFHGLQITQTDHQWSATIIFDL